MQMSTNILKSMAIQSVVQTLGWDQYGSIVQFMKSLKTFSTPIYIRRQLNA